MEPLINAARDGNLKEARRILDSGVDVNLAGEDGATALHDAAHEGHARVIALLIERGADLKARTVNFGDGDGITYGVTPLHFAALNGHKQVVSLLIKHGADVNACDDAGMTPLHYAATWGRTTTAKLLLENGADVNAEREDGFTPLGVAYEYPEPSMVELLERYARDE